MSRESEGADNLAAAFEKIRNSAAAAGYDLPETVEKHFLQVNVFITFLVHLSSDLSTFDLSELFQVF